jgi:antitoxin component HigA of HigAB toxin-antitoxin module
VVIYVNTNAFKAAMVYNGDTQATTAEFLGISRVALSEKLNQKYDFRVPEIKMLCKRWKLTPEKVYEIFIE